MASLPLPLIFIGGIVVLFVVDWSPLFTRFRGLTYVVDMNNLYARALQKVDAVA